MLGLANLIYVILLVGGALIIPLERYPAALRPVIEALPTAALGEGLRAAANGQVLAWPVLVLLAWLLAAGLAAWKGFRWTSWRQLPPEADMARTGGPLSPVLRVVRGPYALRRWAVVSLVMNVLIVVTGGLVRLTGSGLGCPTWPRCTEDSLRLPSATRYPWSYRVRELVVHPSC